MPQISPNLAVESGLNYVELHILDGYDQSILCFELTPDECRLLSDTLKTIRPLPAVVDIKAEHVDPVVTAETAKVEQLELPLVLEEGEDPEEASLVSPEIPTGEPVGKEVIEDFAPSGSITIDWASLTKTGIVDTAFALFGVTLDASLRKDDLIAKAVELEETSL
jgi:hypothetical protein